MSTYQPIATQTLGSAASSVTFSSLPQNYTDLIIVFNGSTSSGNLMKIKFNGDTNSNYSVTTMYGTGSSAVSSRYSESWIWVIPDSANAMQNAIIQLQNYSNQTTYKTFLSRASLPGASVNATVGLWRSTAPITSVDIVTSSGNWTSGSTFTIYGVAAGNSSAKATGGNIVTTDGTYWYHTFTSSGTFIPSQALTADVLVVAGGGGGGGTYGGGGGGGGLCYQTGRSLSANSVYTTVIGAGGSRSANGGNSIFDTITAIGGGAGGMSSPLRNAANGGSGGGAEYINYVVGNATQGNSGGATGYGFNGGSRVGSTNYAVGAGGGGAGSVGADCNMTTGVGGNGGSGRSYSISGSSITYAGGGGGSAEAGRTAGTATGGGGAGTTSGYATNGTVNLGGGGGGGALPVGSDRETGGLGGSGIVIIRYAV